MAATHESMALAEQRPLLWRSHGISDTGKVRRHNEDSMLERPDIGLWVVADGMGGHAAGDVASNMIISSLQELPPPQSLPKFIDTIEDRMLQVNRQLVDKAHEDGQQLTIGSTMVALVAYQRLGIFLWAGDSRLYRYREGQLEQLSTDHSQVEMYVERGLMTREQASRHPHGNMITRAVGANEALFLDMDLCSLRSGDRFLLCSDGLTKHLSDTDIHNILSGGDADDSCERFIELTLTRGAADNVTAIVVEIL